MNTVTCKQEKDTVSVAIVNVTVSATGERWVCSQFPFLKSNPVLLSNYGESSQLYSSIKCCCLIMVSRDNYPASKGNPVLLSNYGASLTFFHL